MAEDNEKKQLNMFQDGLQSNVFIDEQKYYNQDQLKDLERRVKIINCQNLLKFMEIIIDNRINTQFRAEVQDNVEKDI